MVGATGFTPASFRLENGCLIYSTTAANLNWSARQELHLRSLGPKPSALLLRYALMLRAVFKNAGVEMRKAETLRISFTVSSEIGGPEGTCTLSLPADNGLLL